MFIGLDIPSEIDLLEKKIDTINNLFQERRQKRLGGILFFLALLGLASAIWDGSEYFRAMSGYKEAGFYPIGGIVVASAIFVFLLIFLIKNPFNSNKNR